jgi:hypothetical protein
MTEKCLEQQSLWTHQASPVLLSFDVPLLESVYLDCFWSLTALWAIVGGSVAKVYCGPSRVALPLDAKYLRIPLIGLVTKVHSQDNQSGGFVADSSKIV